MGAPLTQADRRVHLTTRGRATALVLLCGLLAASCNGVPGPGTPSPAAAGSSLGTGSATPTPTCDPSPYPSPRTLYRTGAATLDFATGTQRRVVLNHLTNDWVISSFGIACPSDAQAVWANDGEQWMLTIEANVDGDLFSAPYRSIEIENYTTEPPLEADGSGCRITITEISATGFVGQAVCHGLRWVNDYDTASNPNPSPIPNLSPFDVSLTFEARP